MSLWDWLLNPAGLTAHGFCLSWAPGLVALHAGSDAVVGLAYLSIPLALAAFIHRRPDLKYGWVAYLFVAFILACGATHLFSILTLWVPAYGVEGLVKLLTAILSIATAAVLWRLLPRAVALPSAAQLAGANAQLAATNVEQEQMAAQLRESEAQVRRSNSELERRVAKRTAQLTAANARLTEVLDERTREQHALARSEAEFRASFEAAAVGKSQTDPFTGRILRANHAFARMLGYEPADLIGRPNWDFTWPEDRAAEMAEHARVLAGEADVYVREKRYLHRDGRPVWGRISATIVRLPDSRAPVLTVAVIEDIDESHRAQIALHDAKRDLETVVAERTGALTQRDLLLKEVYHRVKNNLQIIDSLLVMQARQLADPEAKAALLGLRKRVYALGLVHHQLMDSANLKTFDVAPFLQELSSNIVEGAAAPGISLTVRAVPLDVGLDFAIPLGLLVTELVTNSLKHAFPGGKGAIDVFLDRGEDGSVVLVVSDDGAGYAASASPAGRKVALGTSIIKGLVAQLGGTMNTRNDGGTRSEIHLSAPAAA